MWFAVGVLSTQQPCARRFTKMARLPIGSWIGNAAAVLTGAWGAVPHQAKDAGGSRQTAYDHAEKVEAAVRDAAGGGPSCEQLQQHMRQQAAEIAALNKKRSLVMCDGVSRERTATLGRHGYGDGFELRPGTGAAGDRRQKNAPVGRRSRDG